MYSLPPIRRAKYLSNFLVSSSSSPASMAQVEVVFKIKNMTDEKTKKKAIEAATDILGLDYIGANLQEQNLTVRGTMDVDELAKWLTKKVGKIEIIS